MFSFLSKINRMLRFKKGEITINLDNSHHERGLYYCKEDLKHHSQFFASGSKNGSTHTPSPVEVVEMASSMGIITLDYLDSFPRDSIYYDEIQQFKKRLPISLEY